MTDNTFSNPLFVLTSFHAFNNQHLMALGTILVLGVLIFMAGRSEKTSRREWLGRSLGFLLLGYVVTIYVQQGMSHTLSWEYSLPLDLCSLVLAACIVALFRPKPFIIEIAYFWGMGGALQATLTPDLAQGFPSWDFLLFFWGHGATLLAILFLISDRKFVPGKGAILRMMIALNVYALVVGTMDALTGWNYGYLCRKPEMPSLLDFIGPWPWYLLSLEGIALLMFLILDLPWRFLKGERR